MPPVVTSSLAGRLGAAERADELLLGGIPDRLPAARRAGEFGERSGFAHRCRMTRSAGLPNEVADHPPRLPSASRSASSIPRRRACSATSCGNAAAHSRRRAAWDVRARTATSCSARCCTAPERQSATSPAPSVQRSRDRVRGTRLAAASQLAFASLASVSASQSRAARAPRLRGDPARAPAAPERKARTPALAARRADCLRRIMVSLSGRCRRRRA